MRLLLTTILLVLMVIIISSCGTSRVYHTVDIMSTKTGTLHQARISAAISQYVSKGDTVTVETRASKIRVVGIYRKDYKDYTYCGFIVLNTSYEDN